MIVAEFLVSLSYMVVDVQNFAGLFSPVDGQITHFKLKMERYGVQAAQLYPAAGHLFQHYHQALAHQIAKGISGAVPA